MKKLFTLSFLVLGFVAQAQVMPVGFITQIASKAMITTEPSGAVNGVALTTQPVIRITDASGNTVTTSKVSVVASIASGSGTLNGTKTVAAVGGVATFTDLVLSGTPGSFTLTFTPTSLTAATSSSFALAAGAASKAMMTTEPDGAVNGSAFGTQPVVRITDASGNTVTTSTVNVVASIASGSGTLSGTTTVAAVAGVATFTDLVITGTGSHTLTFTPAALTAVTSGTFSVTVPVVPTQVALTRASVGTGYGLAFTTQPQVTIQDVSGNTVTTSSAVVTATISAGGTLVGTKTATAFSGVATFSNLGIKGTATAYTITYTVSGLTAATQSVTPTALSIGSTGPGGGKVFYAASSSGFACGPTLAERCYYLEVAPASANSSKDWSSPAYDAISVPGGTPGTAIGSGYQNTMAIIAQGNGTDSAAGYAQAYRGGGLSDWYLGTRLELYQIYLNRANVITGTNVEHGFAGQYWASEQDGSTNAWNYLIHPNPGGPWSDRKEGPNSVRPIRSF